MTKISFLANSRQYFLMFLFACILGTTSHPSSASGVEELPIEDLRLFSEVFSRIKSEYFEDIGDAELLKGAINGMLEGLDPHSVYLDPATYRELNIDTQGEFGGLGIEISIDDDAIRVVSPIDGTPAYEAGILAGDLIIKIDDIFVNGMSVDEAVRMMRGQPGTEIRLLILRESETEPLEITLKRAIIRLDSVSSRLLYPKFGYMRVSQFQPGTSKEIQSRLDLLNQDSQNELEGLILDLRDNPGGILGSAVAVTDLFLSKGPIVTTRGRSDSEGSEIIFKATPTDILDGKPMVVIVNGGSASASEIVSGALQDHKRAVIMGERTFGKGSVQTILPMENGGALKLTTALYYTPNNRSIQASGIVPDVVTTALAFASNDMNNLEFRERDLPGYIQNEANDKVLDNDDSGIGAPNSTQIDIQIQQAVNLLKSMVIAQGFSNLNNR
tara:strand:- start:3311 stop:4639 length:1329 start_codon:yes stop_codon:yes gene_type:complete